MSKDQRRRRRDPWREPMPDEALATYLFLGRQLAAWMAEANFRSITAEPGWTAEQVEIETEHAIARMDVGARDLLTKKGAKSNSEHWQAIWTAMETGYREVTAILLRSIGVRTGETLQ